MHLKTDNILNGLVPRPVRVTPTGARLPIDTLNSIRVPPELRRHGNDVIQAFRYFGKELRVVEAADTDITLEVVNTLAMEGWKIEIGPKMIKIGGGDQAGVFYAVSALGQMLALGFARGSEGAFFDGGIIEDQPRFAWRGLMIDSVRHFQSKETIKDVIHLMAGWRLNVFHWHLSDMQGVRLPFTRIPASDKECYTKEDLKEIVAFAADHFIRIVPELDMPGHAYGLLRRFPHFMCHPPRPGEYCGEFCLGNAEAREFLKALLDEVMALFPDSPIIHLGGDEADTAHWDSCPKCRAALERAGLSRMRELENQFMNEMTRHVIAGGRRPMVWCTDAIHPADTIVQAWQNVDEVRRSHFRGNPVVNSVHYCCYFDYPADSTEPRLSWMPELTEENVYQALEPSEEKFDRLLGTEACLWTEIVPEWRVKAKLVSRLAAFAENAWVQPEDRDWHDFQRRKKRLEAAGHPDILRS